MKKDTAFSRRAFLQQSAVLGAAAVLPAPFAATFQPSLRLKAGSTILFQGDSITDGARSRNTDWNHVMGHGYAFAVAGRLGFEYPGRNFHFLNRGVSGNTVPDLARRWQADALALKPDVLSILVGVNDANAAVNGQAGFTAAAYREQYHALLTLTRQQLPDTVLVLGEPFVLPVGRVKNSWEKWSAEVKSRQAAARELAEEFKAVFVPFQSAFDAALAKAPADYWIWDGIHPMPAGHELMARAWIKAVSGKYKMK